MTLNYRSSKQCLRANRTHTPAPREVSADEHAEVEERAKLISQLPDTAKMTFLKLLALAQHPERLEIPDGLTEAQALYLAWYRALDEDERASVYPFVAGQLGAFSALL